jgi:hypothetical protein
MISEHFINAVIKLEDRSISQRRAAMVDADTEVRDWVSLPRI